ncbi:MAG: hypothetical protein Q8L90_17150, partial [Bacteroidota bacterium]|nr:hypothetical protein [Bacteroidota bacterium]
LTIQTRVGNELEFVSTGTNANIHSNAQLDINSTTSLHLLTNGAARLSVLTNGNVGIGTTTPATNARLAINDGHLQSQQTTAPGTSSTNTSAQILTNATDVAGNVSFTPSSVTGSVTVAFNMNYATPPIVIITPTNSVSATDTPYVWVSSTISGFTINFSSAFISLLSHTYSYHVIQTQ